MIALAVAAAEAGRLGAQQLLSLFSRARRRLQALRREVEAQSEAVLAETAQYALLRYIAHAHLFLAPRAVASASTAAATSTASSSTAAAALRVSWQPPAVFEHHSPAVPHYTPPPRTVAVPPAHEVRLISVQSGAVLAWRRVAPGESTCVLGVDAASVPHGGAVSVPQQLTPRCHPLKPARPFRTLSLPSSRGRCACAPSRRLSLSGWRRRRRRSRGWRRLRRRSCTRCRGTAY